MSIILGIDPWTTTTWFAIIERLWNTRKLLNYWIIDTPPKIELWLKLFDIWNDLIWLIENYKPDICSIEKLYFTNNIKTWIDVAHARWVIIYELAKKGIQYREYTPLQVKKWIC